MANNVKLLKNLIFLLFYLSELYSTNINLGLLRLINFHVRLKFSYDFVTYNINVGDPANIAIRV